MLRLLPVTALPAALLASAVALSGCSTTPNEYEARIELSGTATKADVSYLLPDGNGTQKVPGEKVPFNITYVIPAGKVKLEVKPANGTVGCRLLIDGKKVAEQTGAEGESVTCATTIKRP